MSAPRPNFRGERGPDLDDIEVVWAALPDDWRERSPKLRLAGETRSELANRVRARVAEGLVHPLKVEFELRFADRLDDPDGST